MTVGTLVLFIEYTRRLFWPLMQFSEQLNFIQRAFASADRVFGDPRHAVAHAGPDRRARERCRRAWREIAFENVTFVYDGGAQALDDVCFRVAPRREGRAGRPLGRRQDDGDEPAAALLRADRRDGSRSTGSTSATTASAAWREKIGLVLQDIHLFPGTVGDNLRCCATTSRTTALDRALQVVRREEMLARLPAGLRRPSSPRAARTSRWASGSSSPSRARSCATRTSWSSTRRPRRSTRRPSGGCRTRSSGCCRGGPR